LYRVTGETGFLDDARRTAGYVLEHMTSPEGDMLPSEGGDDGGLFKGILVRYLGELIREDEESSGIVEMLMHNAESLWTFGMDPERQLFGPSWTQTPDQVVQMSTQLSGMMLIEQVATLQKEGQLESYISIKGVESP
jgi:predicted alpha-1,6-mannanase (GH76 family)